MADDKKSPRVYSMKRAVHELDLSRSTLERAIAAGRIKAIRLSPRRIGIPASEIERIVQHGISAA